MTPRQLARERQKAIAAVMREHGSSPQEIADVLGVSTKTVYLWHNTGAYEAQKARQRARHVWKGEKPDGTDQEAEE